VDARSTATMSYDNEIFVLHAATYQCYGLEAKLSRGNCGMLRYYSVEL